MSTPEPCLRLLSAYADSSDVLGGHPPQIALGDGLIGQSAADGRRVLISDVPSNVVPIRSGVGLRLGANIGYVKFTPYATWNPF